MVRRAVARQIIQQVRLRRITKQRRMSRAALGTAATAAMAETAATDGNCGLDTYELTSTGAGTAVSICHGSTSTCNGNNAESPATTAVTTSGAATAAAVIAAFVAAMSVERTDIQPSTCNEMYTPQVTDSDDQFQLIRRIAELQCEKEQLLHVIQHTF
ncbi:hypothetical protein COEREDRAFT_91258 [Coemansia reversa NRRL 1564]|uniref:Uncharacterized protein n=1 Tax=Coemansia reversa (strain ATCC 12441 / NRRL 1564) TaxID=763665 RepID=A0A2G5BH53_COERN|nr:hypothetical protein COEREDRAFT_91258 [Coemansia reversa NRRL 1564]|eukprot:PIA18354.1 hypothetical protein COEREDRAFT_91258 [Coemansia reversa NRRL 1564]